MAKTGRIMIRKIISEIVDGRREDKKQDFWKCWATVQSLNTKEKYEALQNGFENVLVFKVRTCKTVEEIRLDVRRYTAVYKDVEYDIYEATPMYTDPGHYLLKCRSVG